ncbi:hypothetical protein [Levilactobacillus andaensis]|uniref:hypothetical protein n=1 Tax=Levilactobacillus andaensis TaxID=2799570 RepID=UPI001942FFE6|nr:hypothetical protein [Levilactobacillus andaensis]
MILTTVFATKTLQFFLRMSIYVVLGIVVLCVRAYNRRKTHDRLQKRTEYMMKHTKKNKNGKYPWEEGEPVVKRERW